MSQNQIVLNHLIDHGYITDVIARNYGVRRLASRIYDLRTGGLSRIEVQTRIDDSGIRYAFYSMSESNRDLERNYRDHSGVGWNCRPLKAAA